MHIDKSLSHGLLFVGKREDAMKLGWVNWLQLLALALSVHPFIKVLSAAPSRIL